MGRHDHTGAERQQRLRDRRKLSGSVEVRVRVPPDLAPELKRIAAEMRDLETAKAYRQRMKSEGHD